MRVKRFLVSLFLVFTLMLSSISIFAFAAPKAGSSGFKSGGFKSSTPKITSPIKPSSGSSFKSGIFKKATPNTSKKYSTSQKSYIPIPFPVPMFRSHYYGGVGYSIFSFWYFIKLIIKIILLIMFIKFLIKIFKR